MTARNTRSFRLSRRRSSFVGVALPILLLLAVPDRVESRPTQSAVEVIEAGWAGAAVHDTWTPVRLRVRGGAQELEVLAEVIVDAEISMGRQQRGLRYPIGSYGHELSLPPGETREVTVWFPASSGSGAFTARARLWAGGETLAETAVPIKVTRAGWPLMGVLAEDGAVGRLLRGIELPYQGLPVPLAVAELEPDAIPESGDRLQALSALVVHGSAAAELTDAQRAALLEWIQGGGDLLLSGGPGAAYAMQVLPDGALPVTYLDVDAAAPIGALGDWVASTDDAPSSGPVARFRSEGGAVLAGEEGAPLAWRMTVGRGTVTLLAIDPVLEPIVSWAGAGALLRAALSPALPDVADNPWLAMWAATNVSMHMQGVAGTLPPDAHPAWPIAAILLACFALAVGPIVYFLLRRIDRRELSWVVVPLIAVSASAGIYVWGVRGRGSDLVANVSSYIEIDSGHAARQSVMAAFYGPTHRELSVALGQETAVRALVGAPGFAPWQLASWMFTLMGQQAESSDDAALPTEAPFQVIDGANRRVHFVEGQYGPRQIFFQRELSEAPRVRAEISVEDGLLVGMVRNESGLPLEDAALIVGSSLLRLGTLAPGQSVPVRLDPPTSSDLWGYRPHSAKLFGERVSGPGPNTVSTGDDEWHVIPNDPEVQRRAGFLEQMIESRGRWMGRPSLPLSFVAFTRAPTVDASLFAGRPNHQLTLLMQRLELVLGPGRFTLPPGVTPSRMISMSSGLGGGGNGQLTWAELQSGYVTYAFRPPLPPGARAEALVLTTEAVAEAAIAAPPAQGGVDPSRSELVEPAAEGVFSVYDWRSDEWTPLPAQTEHRLDPEYLGPVGELRVRISARDNRLVRFVAPTVAVEGSVGTGGQP